MTIARNSVFAGVVVSLAALAACQSAGPGGPGAAPSGVEGEWMSSDGVAVSTLLGRRVSTSAPSTPATSSPKAATSSTGEHGADHRHLGDPPVADQLQLPARLAEAAELHELRRPAFLADPPRLTPTLQRTGWLRPVGVLPDAAA